MKYVNEIRAGFVVALLGGLGVAAGPVAEAGSVVRFDTVVGSFDIELFDDEAPLHVANFLEYVESGDYNNSVVHRNARSNDGSPFVVQGGLSTFAGTPVTDPNDLPTITTRGTVTNEPGISNTRGTLALARVGGQVNSGTSQWFINLDDNSALDNVDEGFTVFGEVLGDGLAVVDAIAALPNADFGGPFNDTPLRNVDNLAEFQALQGTDENPGSGFGEDELVVINSVTLLADEPIFVDEGDDEDGSADDGDGSGGDSGDGAESVPTPGAFAAGLLGLGVLVSRRRVTK